MTTLDQYPPLAPEFTVDPFSSPGFDTYRDIHKGIRAELFAVTTSAGRTDPGDREARAALSSHVGDLVALLEEHAGHEDKHVLPVLEAHAPALFERNASDHAVLDTRLIRIAERAGAIRDAVPVEQRARVHNLYLDLASYTSTYLAHQEFEERIVQPALIDAIGIEGVVAVHGAIVGSIPPAEMAKSLALMIPAMNIDDRSEMLSAMRLNAPEPVFEGMWRLVASVLEPGDFVELDHRLNIA